MEFEKYRSKASNEKEFLSFSSSPEIDATLVLTFFEVIIYLVIHMDCF